ncbi:MAG: glycine dehydrogenase (aminomethyl-transferring) [Bacteroidetes bacterium GWF2_33_38]|nr:MAG: glycine dehydrogenase (aminomethyl-transferring) [Bacteroidetes bacterium GWF2_33_38]OFY68974.1 MAG: glycine dehydrogenase (aminomethyl-transferring) [Bacteroidetes bacterium RIFOXYA12_FULL_33_9]OFY92087.1 MAG: glycine dehydrogenase (aminomethyl-transferring) [Bacteroidetes bacterium RIFOXYA2_FULL_33_7]HBX52636.1 glycine dehydrogenase (aminomethyl-transferring) [Bacteroidales bacterium]
MVIGSYLSRHNGPRNHEIDLMLKKIGVKTVDQLIDETVPTSIRLQKPLNVHAEGISEYEYLKKLKEIASKNKIFGSYIGMGYYNTILPSVILRNMLENPSWYTSYTPYQAEISQGRLEALLNFQTMIMELTGMEIANSSLLDESTAAAEAMIMMQGNRSRTAVKNNANILFVDENIFPQNLAVIRTRAEYLGVEVVVGKYNEFKFNEMVFGAVVQYPAGDGKVNDYAKFVEDAHKVEALVTVVADIMSLVLLTPPGEWGADIVVGLTQRFGIPMGYGGPHAAYLATSEKYKRTMPGRIIGISVDANENKAYRMALQTREQHIKRERATSNICTAQALLANMAGMYAVYHGPEGLKNIASKIHSATTLVANKLKEFGYSLMNDNFFDTLKIELPNSIKSKNIEKIAIDNNINLRYFDEKTVGLSLDETTSLQDVIILLNVFAEAVNKQVGEIKPSKELGFDKKFERKSQILKQEVFNKYHSETELMRYIKKLERKDFSLTHSMISLGSCTMKLNPATSMLALSWSEFGQLHPFAPKNQAEGYHILFNELETYLKAVTGFDSFSFQPNSGAAGEYAGLLVIREYQKSIGQSHRNVVLIPSSAHGTNPASAAMAGLDIIVVDCDEKGNINVDDLKVKAEQHKDNLSCFMVTYPSTHGVFESRIREMIELIHKFGGQVYMDGANMNAQVGLTSPANVGADVCHLNLHKTFAIPHGGGGPGVGPIGVAKHLATFLPSHPVVKTGGEKGISAVSAAPWGSASILTISHAYCHMLGANGLTEATKMAILNANYLAASLKDYYDILYTGETGRVAHEMILDCRGFKDAHVSEADIAKRLMDFGFHAPTLSFPVHGTLMIEPTESESLQELNRFVESMITIHNEITEIREGKADMEDNVLRNAPHTSNELISDTWSHKYGREKAAFPLKWIAENKFFPSVKRINDAYGDRNLVCSCEPIESYIK